MTRYTMAEITLPDNTNAGNPMTNVHAHLRYMLCARYGGFTAIPATGGWKSEDRVQVEPVTVYRVRVEDNAFEASRLVEIAQTLANGADQELIFINAPTLGPVMVDREGKLS